MSDQPTITDFAVRYRTTPGALRHYERLGLLDERHVLRTPGNYRTYTDEAAERLRLINLGRTVGLSLEQLRTWIDEWESGTMTEDARIALFTAHLATLDTQIEHLAGTRAYLVGKLTGQADAADCDSGAPG